MADMTSNLNKMRTHVDAMVRAAAIAGKEGLERDLAAIQNKKEEWTQDYEKAMDAAQKAAEILWTAGKYDQATKILTNMQAEKDKFEAALNTDIAGKTAEWAKREADKWQKTLVDVRDIDQNVAEIIKMINKYTAEVGNMQGRFNVEIAKGTASSSMDAQIAEAKREYENTIAQINQWPLNVEKANKEAYDKLTKYGKHPSQEAADLYNKTAQDSTNSVNEQVAKAAQIAVDRYNQTVGNIELKGSTEEQKRTQDLIVQYAELTEDTKGLSGAKLELINITAKLNTLNAQSSQEKTMIEEIRRIQVWKEEMKQTGDVISGLRYGMWDLARQSPTMWDTGIEMAKKMKGAFDGIADSLTELVTTGKADFTSFATSVIKDLVRMMIQASITTPLFNGLAGLFGLSPVSSTGALSPGGGSIFGGNASLSGISQMHDGTYGTVLRNVSPWAFMGAARYHSGLMGDEFPAILQKGETVIPRGGKFGNTIATTIQVNVNGQQGGGGGNGDSHQLGSEIATVVKAEFDKNLSRHLQPGGMLNRGMGY